MTLELVLARLGLVAIGLPVLAALALGVPFVLGIRLSERAVYRTVAAAFGGSLLACVGADAIVLGRPTAAPVVTLAQWLVLPGYAIDARLVFDVPAVVLMTLTAGLCVLVGAFSAPYLHRDPGFKRFYVLLSVFGAGMMAIASGATLDLVYAGWEVVGIASALLIAFFTYREGPVRHGLRAFAVYRVCDVALLTAAILLHHAAHDASLTTAHVTGGIGLWIAGLLVFASLGKSAAFPFTGWLPRAMEGPTSSSAIFYGALSVHAGPFVLIRAWPLLEPATAARAALVAIGVVTAVHATVVGRVQTDAKTSLGYASITQVGVILAEIGLGLPMLALAHLAGHAILRTWQLLRAPSILADREQLVAMLGGAPPPRGTHWERLLPRGVRRWLYRVSLERWYVDDLVANRVLAPAARLLRLVDTADRAFVRRVSGADPGPARGGDR